MQGSGLDRGSSTRSNFGSVITQLPLRSRLFAFAIALCGLARQGATLAVGQLIALELDLYKLPACTHRQSAAEKLGVHKTTIARWLKLGVGNLPGTTLPKLEDASGVELHMLMGVNPFPRR
jgi:hypothetical protein